MSWRIIILGSAALAAASLLVTSCEQLDVSAVDVAEVEIVPNAATVVVGGTRQLDVVMRDAAGNRLNGRPVVWSSRDPGTAAAESDGSVRGIAPGAAVVTATSGGVTGEAQITVMAEPALRLEPGQATLTAAEGSTAPVGTSATVSNSGGEVSDLRARVSYLPDQPQGWLQARLDGTSTPATMTVEATAAGLPRGTYRATAVAESPSTGAFVTMAVEFNVVEPAPIIELGAGALSFQAEVGGTDPPAQPVTVRNSGGGSLSGLGASVTYDAGQPGGWLLASLSPSTAPSTLTVTARTGALPTGTYSATVLVTGAGAANSPASLRVTFTVGEASSRIGVSESAHSFTASAGGADPAAQTVAITNEGGGTLSNLTASVAYGAGQPTGWLTATLSSSSAPATLTLQPRTGSLAPGSYQAIVEVASPAAANSPLPITVSLQVVEPAPASIALDPTSVTFAATAGGASPAEQTVAVTNSGSGTLSGLSVQVLYDDGQPTGWLGATIDPSTAPATLKLQATTGSLAAGTYGATARVSSNDAANSPQDVDVTFQIGAAPTTPAIALAPTSLTFTAVALTGDPAAKTVDVTNGGTGTLSGLSTSIRYGSGQPTGWLTASLDGTTAPAKLTVQPKTGTLLPGTYTASIDVASAVATNSPQSVSVTFQVTAPLLTPAISLSATSASFSAQAGGGNPSPREIDVTNSGGGTLDDLTTAILYTQGQPSGWLSATLGSSTAPTKLTLSATTGSLAAGTYNATVEVRSAKASNSPQSVQVTFTVTAAPAIGLNPTSVTFGATQGGANPSSQNVSVSNTGGGTLSGLSTTIVYASGQPTGWLSASLGSTTAPTQLALAATTGSLAAGTYQATVRVQSSAASNSPQNVAVTFTVAPSQSVPAAPTQLRADERGEDRILLRWNDNSNNEEFFRIQRSPIDFPYLWSDVATVQANTESHMDTGLQEDTRYWYRVFACNAAGCSVSNIVSERTEDD